MQTLFFLKKIGKRCYIFLKVMFIQLEYFILERKMVLITDFEIQMREDFKLSSWGGEHQQILPSSQLLSRVQEP